MRLGVHGKSRAVGRLEIGGQRFVCRENDTGFNDPNVAPDEDVVGGPLERAVDVGAAMNGPHNQTGQRKPDACLLGA